MRLVKLSLLLIACCMLAQAQTAPGKNDTAVSVPPHSPNQLLHRFDYARFSSVFLSNDLFAQRMRQSASGRRPFAIDPGIELNTRSSIDSNTCFKLRKYIFQPKEQTEKNGMLPLGDEMRFAGETDCTYANKVWPKSADGAKPPRPQFGPQSAVMWQK